MKNRRVFMLKRDIFVITFGIMICTFFSVFSNVSFSTNSEVLSATTSVSNIPGTIQSLKTNANDYSAMDAKVDGLLGLLLDFKYPVGSIYFSTNETTVTAVKNKLGGTWEAYGTGKVLVGVDANNTSFSSSGKTGGSLETSLAVTNLPSHSHTVTPKGNVTSTFKGDSLTTSSNGNHSHNAYHRGFFAIDHMFDEPEEFISREIISSDPKDNVGWTSTDGSHSHTFTAKGSVSSTFTGSSATSSAVGDGTKFTNLQPYVTLYMYKRVS